MLTVDFDLLDVRPGQVFLDAGCGGGRHSYEAWRRGADVIAMDYDLSECKRVLYSFASAEEERRGGEGKWDMVRADVIRLPFAGETVDRVICAEVCEHLHEDMRVLRDICRVMKRGARIAVTVPTAFSDALYGLIEPFYFENPGGHVRIFTPRELAEKMRAAGLKVYAVRHAHGLHTPYWLLRCVFGLTDEDHPVPGMYKKFLDLTLRSRPLAAIERAVFDKVCPKSIIIYAWKP